MKHQILALAVAALSFTACTNEDNISQDYLADTPIKLNVSVDEPTTRAGYSDADKPTGFVLEVEPNGKLKDKYSYKVWAEWEDNNWKTYDLTKYRNDGTKEEVTMLWANMNNKVAVSAISDVDYYAAAAKEISNHPTDQTTLAALKKADFLTMPYTQVDPTQSGINVKFKHTMSKINLTIELGDEYEFIADVDKKITDVKIDGSKIKAYYTFMASTENTQFYFYAYGDPTPITPYRTGTKPYSKTDGKASATYEAILIPQDIASGEFTVSFKVDGKLYEWVYNNEAGLTLDPSTAYTLKLIAGDDKVQPVSFSVAAWKAGNGDGENKETD